MTDKKRSKKKTWLIVVLVLLLFSGTTWWAMETIQDRGWTFFNNGRQIVEFLADVSVALERQDREFLARCYAENYRGTPLGLTRLELTDERDGVRVERFVTTYDELDKEAAVDEWMEYLADFAEIEEAMLHIHRFPRWRGDELEAVVRYELIGRLEGASRPLIDRAYFRLRFARQGESFEIVEGGLTTAPPEENHEFGGERIAGETPLFNDVAPAAGVDFENQWYPAFLDQDLAFGMIRYGPGGITAADVDNDGYSDLFIPDGVESRFFLNNQDGTFEDVTEASGLSGLDGVSVGLFADFDNDGDRDFFVSRTFSPNQVFENQGVDESGVPIFVDVTAQTGIGEDCCTTVASVADVDNDGFLDLYVGRYLDPRLKIPTTFYARNGEPNQLYLNRGDFTFENVTETAGVGELGLCLGTVFGDYDNDGDADLYVVNDFGRKTLYRNEGFDESGVLRFKDVTVETGTLAYGAGMSASFGDYDNDGLLDIYVAHIRSEGGWYAELPTVLRYMLNTWTQGVWKTDMPLYMEILNQSGTNFVQVFQDMASGNTLLRNRGDGTFEDVTWAARANPPGWFWGSGFYDFDNDGWQDIYSANGWVYNEPGTEIEIDFLNNVVSYMNEYKTGKYFDPEHFGTQSWHGWERNRHLRNERDGTFREIGRAAGTDLLTNSRGIAVADFWNRGVLDLAVAASTDRHVLLKNALEGERHWLAVEAVGKGTPEGSNRDGVGARVTIQIGDQVQTREVVLGDGYGAQSALRVHFGLGEAETVDELVVRWPKTGEEQRFTDVAGDRIVEVLEGRGELVEKRYGEIEEGGEAGEVLAP